MEFAEFIKTPQVDNVVLYQPNQNPVEGTLCVTGHHLILSSRQDHKEELWVLVYFFDLFGLEVKHTFPVMFGLEGDMLNWDGWLQLSNFEFHSVFTLSSLPH